FPAGEIDVLVPQLDRVTQQIHAYAAMGDHGLLYRRLAPQQGTYVGEQFIEAEGLGQVIVGAEVETLDAILHRVARAEDEHGLVEAGAAPFREQVQAVAVGQAEVENDHVIVGFGQRIAGLPAGADPAHRVGAFAEPLLEKLAETLLVFDDENLHGAPACRHCATSVCPHRTQPVTRRTKRRAAGLHRCDPLPLAQSRAARRHPLHSRQSSRTESMVRYALLLSTALLAPPLLAQTAAPNYAQHLVDETLAAHPDIAIMALHVTPPKQTDNIIIASNIGRIGKKADSDDMGVVNTGKPAMAVNAEGDHFEVELPLQ